MKTVLLTTSCLLATLFAAPASSDLAEYRLTIKNHRFEPAHLTIPANQKVKLIVENLDSTPEEFESHQLNREKLVPGNSRITLYIGPLNPGNYPFFGEFNPKSATGTLIAK